MTFSNFKNTEKRERRKKVYIFFPTNLLSSLPPPRAVAQRQLRLQEKHPERRGDDQRRAGRDVGRRGERTHEQRRRRDGRARERERGEGRLAPGLDGLADAVFSLFRGREQGVGGLLGAELLLLLERGHGPEKGGRRRWSRGKRGLGDVMMTKGLFFSPLGLLFFLCGR